MGRTRSPWRRFLALALILLATSACGGRGGPAVLTDLTAPEPAPLVAPQLPLLPPPMIDPQPGRRIALADNILYGSEYWDCSETGAQVVGDSLELSTVETATAWGVWAWGEFPGDVLPVQLRGELTLDEGNEYWLLLPDFTRGRWRTLGPYADALLVMDYEDPASSISQSGWTYIVIVACEGSTVLVDRLNLIADERVLELPGPREVHVEELGGSWAKIAWTAPEDMLPLGYRVFLGPWADFELADEGVEMMHSGLVEDKWFRIEGLLCETEYHCRVHAYYLGSQFSRLSNTASFTTTDSLPPEVSFRWYPEVGQVDVPVFFNPADTTDADTPQDELVFKWDFDDDGEIDIETQGPATVKHVFEHRGLLPVTLTVFDGRDTSLTQSVKVSFRYEYYRTAASSGYESDVVAVDADRQGERIAVLLEQNNSHIVRYFTGSVWQTIDASELEATLFADVALTPDGVALLLVSGNEGAVDWSMQVHDGLTWTEEHSGSVPAVIRIGEEGPYELPQQGYWGGLDIAANGRISVGMITGVFTWWPLPFFPRVEMSMYIWHEKADGTFTENTDDSSDPRPVFIGYPGEWPGAARRTDTTSYFIYCSKYVEDRSDAKWMLWEFSDGGNSLEVLREDSGTVTVTGIVTDLDASSGELCWAAATDELRIYYGDNYGTPASDQYYELATAITSLIGVRSRGDNESQFYWTDFDGEIYQHLYGYDTTGGEPFELLSGPGVAAVGAGAPHVQNAEEGIYAVVDEVRDGECTGHFIAGDNLESSETIHSAAGEYDILNHHVPLVFADGTVLCLSEQRFATARAATAPQVGEEFSISDIGLDTWCVPDTACITATAAVYIVGSYLSSEAGSALELNHYTLGDTTGQAELVISGSTFAHLQHSRDTGQTIVCYALPDTDTIEVRYWAGFAWSLPIEIFQASAEIEALNIVGNPLGGWGVVCIDASDKVWLIERSVLWSPAELLLTEPVNGPAQVGIDYSSSGALGVAVERDTDPFEIYLGQRPPAGDWDWTVVATSENEYHTGSIQMSYSAATPLVIFHQKRDQKEGAWIKDASHVTSTSRIQVVEEFDGVWYPSELPFQLHGSPLGYTRDNDGNIVIAGYSMSSTPHRAVVAILYE